MGDELKRAVAAAKAIRWPVWAIEWRGRITQDVGTDYEQQPSIKAAREMFQNRYPMREIVAISRAKTEVMKGKQS
jgi:hypothetical protein